MSSRHAYEIPFVSLKQGIHMYRYEITDKFFADFKDQDFTDCQAVVDLALEKNPTLMRLKFDISGSVRVSCDRCGNPLKINLWDEFNIIVKMVENPDEMNEQEEDPDIYYIGLQESHLHLSDWIYEFINLSIPYQRECAEDEIGGPQCNKEVLEKLRRMREETEKGSNSIWKGLENLNLNDENQEDNETK